MLKRKSSLKDKLDAQEEARLKLEAVEAKKVEKVSKPKKKK